MSYTLRQVQPLLSKPELELFQASRAVPIKAIPLARLASKIQRSRALRDKYRDVYRRQTLQTRAAAPKARKPLGGENTRTQTKADIMDEVLKRFEAQQQKLQVAAAKTVSAKGTSKPRSAAPKKTATAASAPVSKTAPRKKQTPDTASVSAGIKRLQKIVKAVRKKVTEGVAASSDTGGTAAPRAKRPAKDSKAKALSSAPTDTTPGAKRANPLKAEPVKQKIHASARSRTRAVQAKRDAR